MKLDRVFLAFSKKDGEEHLLYKKDKGLYIDLNTNEKINGVDLDLTTLIYFKDSIECYGYDHFKSFIKKKYKEDRSKLIDIKRLCIVDVKQVGNLDREKIGDYKTVYKWYARHIYRTLLEDYGLGYRNIRNNDIYHDQTFWLNENEIYVETGKDSNIKYLSVLYPKQKCMEKGKILKLQYDIENNKEKN